MILPFRDSRRPRGHPAGVDSTRSDAAVLRRELPTHYDQPRSTWVCLSVCDSVYVRLSSARSISFLLMGVVPCSASFIPS